MPVRKTTVAGTADDPTIRFAKLELEGEDTTYRLAFDFNSLAIAERMTGLNLLRGLGDIFRNDFSVQELRAVLYGALLIAHPEITIEEAGRLIRWDRIQPIVAALLEAFKLSTPVKNEEPEVLEAAS